MWGDLSHSLASSDLQVGTRRRRRTKVVSVGRDTSISLSPPFFLSPLFLPSFLFGRHFYHSQLLLFLSLPLLSDPSTLQWCKHGMVKVMVVT